MLCGRKSNFVGWITLILMIFLYLFYISYLDDLYNVISLWLEIRLGVAIPNGYKRFYYYYFEYKQWVPPSPPHVPSIDINETYSIIHSLLQNKFPLFGRSQSQAIQNESVLQLTILLTLVILYLSSAPICFYCLLLFASLAIFHIWSHIQPVSWFSFLSVWWTIWWLPLFL